jgi:hypothetical protein
MRGLTAAGRLLGAAPLLLVAACAGSGRPAVRPIGRLELVYQRLRYWDDQQRLLQSLGGDTTPTGLPSAGVAESLSTARGRFRRHLADSVVPLADPDSAARVTMLEAWRDGLDGTVAEGSGPTPADTACDYDPDSLAGAPHGLELLGARVLDCYGRAAGTIVVDGDTLNRLAILGRLAATGDPARRRHLFLALDPVWRSLNGDDSAASPYRAMLRLRRAAWGDSASPIEAKAPAFGLTTRELERWLERALETWRRGMPDTLVEPWDFYYFAGAASRRLSPRIPAVADIRRVNDAFYRSLGADPLRLGVHFDLAPRPGKYPVAFTDFGSRNRWEAGRMVPGEPWVFTSYLDGGFENLAELLHETGHAIHIAAITTRPAWTDWPDNDTFTEALADLAAMELYEPEWQQRFLGDSASLAASLRARYAGIVFDMTWALFEIRVHREPEADPNRIWAGLTAKYLGIRPHPEISWWAMRGQLIDGPGYLVNYALGAFLTADMRARAAQRGHPFGGATPDLYHWLRTELYRFGREVPSRTVLRRFLGRDVGPDALLADLARMAGKPAMRDN